MTPVDEFCRIYAANERAMMERTNAELLRMSPVIEPPITLGAVTVDPETFREWSVRFMNSCDPMPSPEVMAMWVRR